MKRFRFSRAFFVLAMVVSACLIAITCSESLAQEEVRTWTSKDKRHTVEASFESYEPDSRQVTLVLQTGERIEVGLRQLSRKTSGSYIAPGKSKKQMGLIG